jgi:hypothetical protein
LPQICPEILVLTIGYDNLGRSAAKDGGQFAGRAEEGHIIDLPIELLVDEVQVSGKLTSLGVVDECAVGSPAVED